MNKIICMKFSKVEEDGTSKEGGENIEIDALIVVDSGFACLFVAKILAYKWFNAVFFIAENFIETDFMIR